MKTVIDFGKIPLANSLLNKKSNKIQKYSLKLGFDTDYNLLQVIDNAPPSKLFTEDYVYDSSASKPMIVHFKKLASEIKKKHPRIKKILEIGANSGAFIDNFNVSKSIAVEPCLNFAVRLRNKKIPTYDKMWTLSLAEKICKEHGKVDVVFSSNTISHIQNLDECFTAIYNVLNDDGLLVIETPSLLEIMDKGSIDLFYHEHHSYFSCISMNALLMKHNMYVSDVKKTPVHGGSYVFYIRKHTKGKPYISDNVKYIMQQEHENHLSNYEYIKRNIQLMLENAKQFGNELTRLKATGDIIVAYGATAKLCSLLNIIGVGNDVIDFVYDTTSYKSHKYIPGVNIQILPYDKTAFQSLPTKYGYTDVYCVLGAWNYKDEILSKEKKFLDNGGIFITHIPQLTKIRTTTK